MVDVYTIPLVKVFNKPKRGRAKKAIKAIKNFVKKHRRLKEEQIAISKELNQKIWERGMFGIPRRVEVELKEIEDKTFVFLKEGTELKEMEKELKEKKKEEKKKGKEKEEKKTKEEIETEKEQKRKLEEKRQKERDAEKAEFKRKQKE